MQIYNEIDFLIQILFYGNKFHLNVVSCKVGHRFSYLSGLLLDKWYQSTHIYIFLLVCNQYHDHWSWTASVVRNGYRLRLDFGRSSVQTIDYLIKIWYLLFLRWVRSRNEKEQKLLARNQNNVSKYCI